LKIRNQSLRRVESAGGGLARKEKDKGWERLRAEIALRTHDQRVD